MTSLCEVVFFVNSNSILTISSLVIVLKIPFKRRNESRKVKIVNILKFSNIAKLIILQNRDVMSFKMRFPKKVEINRDKKKMR